MQKDSVHTRLKAETNMMKYKLDCTMHLLAFWLSTFSFSGWKTPYLYLPFPNGPATLYTGSNTLPNSGQQHIRCSWFSFLVSFFKSEMENGGRNEMENDWTSFFFKKWLVCLFLMCFYFSSISCLQHFKSLKGVSALSILFIVAPSGNHLTLFTIPLQNKQKN